MENRLWPPKNITKTAPWFSKHELPSQYPPKTLIFTQIQRQMTAKDREWSQLSEYDHGWSWRIVNGREWPWMVVDGRQWSVSLHSHIRFWGRKWSWLIVSSRKCARLKIGVMLTFELWNTSKVISTVCQNKEIPHNSLKIQFFGKIRSKWANVPIAYIATQQARKSVGFIPGFAFLVFSTEVKSEFSKISRYFCSVPFFR